MKTKVLLALDTFFHKWDTEQKKAWLGIQPYINGTAADVANWILAGENIHDSSASEFEIASPDTISASAIPVPLPSDLAIKVVFLDAQNAVVTEVEVNRQSHCRLLEPERFRHLNKFSDKQHIEKSVTINGETAAAYPRVFNHQLRQSLQATSSPDDIDPVTPEELAEQLVMKFELGDRQKYDDACFDNLGTPFDATHPNDPLEQSAKGNTTVHATNTHYLMGQLLLIGGDIDQLKRITSFAFYLNGIQYPVGDNSGTTQRIFSTISASFTPDDFSQSITWSDKLAHRINAKVQGDNFSVTKLHPINRFIWRLGAKDETNSGARAMGNLVRWTAFERLDIREKSGVEKPLLIDVNFDQITFTPVITIDVALTRYRKTPDVMEDSSARYPTNSMVVSVQPTASQKARFDSLMHFPGFDIASVQFFALAVDAKIDDINSRSIDYQITPHALKYVDFPWEDGKQLLLFFDTDKPRASSAFPDDIAFTFNDYIYQNAVLVVRLPTQLTLHRKGVNPNNAMQHYIDRTNPFGPRWEYWHTTSSVTNLPDFDALMCDKLDNHAIDLDQLVVTVFNNDRYDYELAQSARRLEAVVNAEFKNIRETDITDPNSFDFDQVIIEDKTNHNRLNLYEQRTDYSLSSGGIQSKQRMTHRNESSALPSIKESEEDTEKPLKKNLYYTFMAVMKDSTSAHQDSVDKILRQQVAEQIGRANYSVRDFYLDVYENIGDGRDLFFNLEHTYGSTILAGAIHGVPNCLDEPILLATEVAFMHTPEDAAPERMRLFEISLSSNAGAETITLQLNKQLLDPQWAQRTSSADNPPNELETSKALAHIQAWQAFTEMYYAQSVDLIAECYEFDIHNINLNKRSNGIQDGLVKTEINIPQARGAIKALVDSVFADLPNATEGFTLPTNHSWSTKCHAVRFRLDVTRREDFVPEADPSYWEVHKRLAKEPPGGVEQLYDHNGAATQMLSHPIIKEQIKRFLIQLRKRSGYIHPSGLEDNKTRNEQFFALLGDGITPEHAIANNNAWIVPAAIKREVGEIELAYCPIGIMPIANDPYLKQNTSQTIRRYFEALQSVIDFEQCAWFKDDATTLASRVNKLTAEDVKTRYQQLISAAAGKFKSLPDPSVDIAELVTSVRELAKNSSDIAHPVGEAVRLHIHTMLSKQPVLFGSLKSLGLIDVNSPDGQPIRKDFFDLFINKDVNENARAVEGYLSPDNLIQKSNLRFTFVEQLDDHQYDNGFGFNAFRGETAERVFEQKPVGELDSAFQIKTKGDMLHVPAGAPIALAQAEVRLASRRPVKNPTLGTVKQTRIQQNLGNKYLPLSALLSGRITVSDTPNSDKDLEPQINSVAAFTEDLDKVVVAAIFKIEGDEESSDVALTNAFENDAFFVLVSNDPMTATSTLHQSVPPKFGALVADLGSTVPFALQASLVDSVLDDENLAYCADIVNRPTIQRTLPDETHRQKVFRIEDNEVEGKLKIIDIPNLRAAHADYPCSVYLFTNRFGDTVLWLEVELPVWEAKYISLVQTRNQAGLGDSQQRIFAPEFATISQAIGDALDRMTKYEQMRNQFSRIEIDNTPKSPMMFVSEVLVNHIDGIDQSFTGKTNLLNVTIKEDSSSAFPSNLTQHNTFNVFNGSFAVKIHQCEEKDWSVPNITWFPEGSSVKRWRIDIEWRDPQTNDEILRIEDVPVYLKTRMDLSSI